MTYDLIIKNGTLIDGNLNAPFPADVGIHGDKITAIGDLQNADANQIIDAAGKIVAPGFLDVHNHSDGWLLKISHLLPKTMQGFTTEVLMADGISYAPVNEQTFRDWIFYLRALNGLRLEDYTGWQSLADYMALLDRRTAQNVMTHLPYANVRSMVVGFGREVSDDSQMRFMQHLIQQGMEQGAVGVSTGLDYIVECFSSTSEIAEACSVMSGGLYVTHVRYMKGTLQGVKEAVEIGKRAKIAVHISHLKSADEKEATAILNYIDTVAVNEVEFSFDVYPYMPSSTMLNYLLPLEAWEQGAMNALGKLTDPKLRYNFSLKLAQMPLENIMIAWLPSKDGAHHIGKRLSDFIAESGQSAADALCDLLIEERMAVLLVFISGDDKWAEPFVMHKNAILATDGIYFPDSLNHPRVYGSVARLLGNYARDQKLMTLPEAVYKLTGFPAQKFGATQRGQIAENYFADVVVFDAEKITDLATYENPHQFSTGMEAVIVNGTPIILEGNPVDDLAYPLPGRYLRYQE